MTYWQRWHDAYADPTSSLNRRLRVVQDQIERWLDETSPRPVRVLSLCSGDARDLLEVLDRRADADRVTATLVELDPDLAARARAAAAHRSRIEVRTADAGDGAVYADLPPADLVLLCGVLGNISDADVEHTIMVLPALCAPGARVIWTRTRRPPDLTPRVRSWFVHNGFREVGFFPVSDSAASVGVADLVTATPVPLGEGRLFTFLAESPNVRTLDVYEQRAEQYEASVGPAPEWLVAFLDRVADAVGRGGAVLELGSGTGDNARYLTERGLVVQPSDGAGAFVEAMRRDGLSPLLIDVLRDDLGGPWDAVVAFAVLLHFTAEELAGVLEQAHTAVRPGGRLALSVKEGDGSAWSDHKLGLPRFFTYWRPESLTRLLAAHGWRVDTLERHAGHRDDWILVIARRSP